MTEEIDQTREAFEAQVQAMRAALAAGPTPGPWAEKGRVHSSRECIRIESRHPSDDHHLYQVVDVLDANDFPTNKANLALILACSPEPITALLAKLDAQAAETEALKADAERYRWLRVSDWDCFDSRWLTQVDVYGQGPADLDAAIDAAREVMPS